MVRVAEAASDRPGGGGDRARDGRPRGFSELKEDALQRAVGGALARETGLQPAGKGQHLHAPWFARKVGACDVTLVDDQGVAACAFELKWGLSDDDREQVAAVVYDVFKLAVLTGDGRCQLGALVLGAPVSLWDPEGEPTGPAGKLLALLPGGRPAERAELVRPRGTADGIANGTGGAPSMPIARSQPVIPAIELRQLAAAPIADASSTWLLGCITVAPARAQLETEEEKAT